jgi:hypothetical protein
VNIKIPKMAAVLITLSGLLETATAQTIFTYSSSPFSYELQGQSGVVTESDGSFGANLSFGSANAVTAYIFSSLPWTMTFAAPNGIPLAVGNYQNAGGTPSTSNPWISFAAFGRKCSQTGSFDVLQIDYGSGGVINSLAIDFTVYDFGQTDEWSQGSFRYNSIIPVPEPSAFALFGSCAAIMLSWFHWRGRMPKPPNNSPEPTPITLLVPNSRLTVLAARLSFGR